MDTHKSMANSNNLRKNRPCGRECILLSKRPDYRACAHLNPVVVLSDVRKSVNGKSHEPEGIREGDRGQEKMGVSEEETQRVRETEEPGAETNVEKRKRKRKPSWDPSVEYEVDRILGYRKYKRYKMLYLVQWKNYENCTTLEPIENLTGCIYELMKCLEKNREPSEAEISRKELELNKMLKGQAVLKELKSNGWKFGELRLFKGLNVKQIFEKGDLGELKVSTEREYRYIVRCLVGMSDHADLGLVQRGLDYLLYLKLIKQRKKQLSQLQEVEKVINGLEKVPIKLENFVDLEKFPKINYITDMVLGKNLMVPGPVLGCDCRKVCSNKSHCCGKLAGSTFAYDNSGRLRFERKIAIYECNSRCKCDETCPNRVVQRGRRFKLCIFKTRECGWGVKSLEDIPKGSFVCEYFGELIRNSEALLRDPEYFRLGKSYVFNLDFDKGNEEMFCIDATVWGNVSRFINHSCDPNLMVLPVWVDCLEVNLHRLGFFAIKDIRKGQELTFDYESADSNERSGSEETETSMSVKGLKCLCGYEKCRGWLFAS